MGPQPGLAPCFGRGQVGVGMSPAGFGHRNGSVPRDPGPPEAILSPNVFPSAVARPGTLHPAPWGHKLGFDDHHGGESSTSHSSGSPGEPAQGRAGQRWGGSAPGSHPWAPTPRLLSPSSHPWAPIPGLPSLGSHPWVPMPRLLLPGSCPTPSWHLQEFAISMEAAGGSDFSAVPVAGNGSRLGIYFNTSLSLSLSRISHSFLVLASLSLAPLRSLSVRAFLSPCPVRPRPPLPPSGQGLVPEPTHQAEEGPEQGL